MSDETAEGIKRSRGRNGNGTTYRYRNGWRTAIQHQGIVITATGASKTESQRKAQLKLKALRPLNRGSNRAATDLDLGTFLSYWIEQEHKYNIAFTTYMRYRGLISNHIAPLIGHINIQRLDKTHINEMVRAMRKAGQSDRSCQFARAVLSVGLGFAVEEELIAVNPVQLSKRVVVKKKPISPLNEHEVLRILNSCSEDSSRLRWRIAVLYGLRQGEALGLRWADIDFEESVLKVRVQVQKTESGLGFTELKSDLSRRDIYLDPETLEMLKSHREVIEEMHHRAGSRWVDCDLVFPNKFGKPMQSSWDNKLWHRALAEAGVDQRRLHDARHTAATLLYSNGIDIEVIRRFLGHSDVGLTSRTYVHSSAKPLKRAAKVMEQFAETKTPL